MIEYTKTEVINGRNVCNGRSLLYGTVYYVYDFPIKKCFIENLGPQTQSVYFHTASEIPKMVKSMESLGLQNIRIIQNGNCPELFACIGYND